MLSHLQRPRSALQRLLIALLVLALSGCAAQMAYRDGKKMAEDNNVAGALQKFKEAIAADPGNAQYRIAYVRTRDTTAARLLEQADAQAASGNGATASASFNQVLALDSGNERARSGLRLLDMQTRHDKLMRAADSAEGKKDYDSARQKLSAILQENPEHDQARSMLRGITDKLAASSASTATGESEAGNGLARQFKKPISIQFKDAPLRQVFDVIARSSGLNFVFDKDVKADQKTSISLKNSSIELAVYYLLVTNQLEQQIVDSNTVMIFPNSAAKLKEYQEMVVKTFFISNADAKVVANTLKTILKSKDIVVDEKLNLVILRDNRESIKLAEKLVALQDIAEPEVMLEVEVLEVKTSRLQELGVAWPSSLSLTPLSNAYGLGLTLADLRHLNQNTIGISNPGITINANKKDGDTNILANPRIRVRNREKARVHIGEKLPSVTTTVSPGAAGFASESVTYIDVGLTLNVEPTIYLNNDVAIKVTLEVSNLLGQIQTKSGTIGYQIGTRQASTLLQLKDGENQVLAGLISNEDRSNGDKLPGVGDLPLLGRLFGSTKDDLQKTEIVLSITPHLVRNIQRPESGTAEFAAGTEANFRAKPEPASRPLTGLPKPAMPVVPAPTTPVMPPNEATTPASAFTTESQQTK
ncbi:tetratricopeptide repeat protein [soil metagenome]